tara:strand:+ start:230 stop:700 length:471 start_codon:yes stop_codon:yes gene_type:complete
MKKLLLILLCLPFLFTSCEKEEQDSASSSNNNSTGTIADVVGVWQYKGKYDNSGSLEPFFSTDYENCVLQNTINLDSLGNVIWTSHYLENEVSGPCLSSTLVFTYNYINSTTLEFIFPSICGNPTVILPSSNQFELPTCNGDNGTYDGGYMLYELQ